MSKTLCKKNKLKESDKPKFQCKKCKEKSDNKKEVCKPEKIHG